MSAKEKRRTETLQCLTALLQLKLNSVRLLEFFLNFSKRFFKVFPVTNSAINSGTANLVAELVLQPCSVPENNCKPW